MRLVSRDPFAREEIHRTVIHLTTAEVNASCGCTTCGSVRYSKTGRASLYRYHMETDGGRKSDIKGLFCSNSCRKTYHG